MVRTAILPVILVACAATSSSDGSSSEGSTSSVGATTSSGAAASTHVDDGTGMTAGVDATGGSSEGTGDTGPVPGGPGCGFESAAFCETFDAPSDVRGRAGDLDASKWSAARTNPQLATGNGRAIAAGPATVTGCRAGLPAQVFPDEDTLVCDANDAIASPHLLVAVGAQNYGQNSYRIRQPFDFAGRTGTIAFDAEGWLINGLLGWISVEITEDPAPLPSFAILNNDEGGPVPRNGVEVQFQTGCLAQPGTVGVRFIDVSADYQDEVYPGPDGSCVAGAQGKLNHFEIKLSEQRIEVWGAPYSEDGETFEPMVMLHAVDAAVPFSRGYVHLTTHNHATIKYSQNDDFGATEVIDAWIARWDDVGFDGPIIDDAREFEVGDSLVMGTDAWNIPGPVMDVGYRVPDFADGTPVVLHVPGVETDGASSARLAVSMWYLLGQDVPHEQYALHYRINGNEWHERPFSAGELALLGTGLIQGELGQMLDVPIAELVAGDNVLEFATSGAPQSYPPAISAIDLIVSK